MALRDGRPFEDNSTDWESFLRAAQFGGFNAIQDPTNPNAGADSAVNPWLEIPPDIAQRNMGPGSAVQEYNGKYYIPSNMLRSIPEYEQYGAISTWKDILKYPAIMAAMVAGGAVAGPGAAGGEASAFPAGSVAGDYALGGVGSGAASGGALAGGVGDTTLIGDPAADTLAGTTAGDAAYTIPSDVAAGYDAAYGAYGGGQTLGGVTGAFAPAAAAAAPSLIPGVPNNVLAGVLQGGLGLLGAEQQADAYENVANQNLAVGAPFRSTLDQSYQPGFDLYSQPGYGDAFNRAAEVATRQWSPRGNPANNPGIQGGILNDVWNQSYLPALSNYRGQLGQFGGLGLNTAGAAQLGGAQTAGGGLNALGYGASTIFNPQPDWSRILNQGQSPLVLNVGGNPWGGR